MKGRNRQSIALLGGLASEIRPLALSSLEQWRS
jgi:hypothetical protein